MVGLGLTLIKKQLLIAEMNAQLVKMLVILRTVHKKHVHVTQNVLMMIITTITMHTALLVRFNSRRRTLLCRNE